ncbi:hypothetical protein CATRI_05070 [Corynebacterium atrinae]|nr:hypothetical protein CATRI_05070 [Corynebacterium atrinae]
MLFSVDHLYYAFAPGLVCDVEPVLVTNFFQRLYEREDAVLDIPLDSFR